MPVRHPGGDLGIRDLSLEFREGRGQSGHINLHVFSRQDGVKGMAWMRSARERAGTERRTRGRTEHPAVRRLGRRVR